MIGKLPKNLCIHIPSAMVNCERNYRCSRCEIADRIRLNRLEKRTEYIMFDYYDAKKQTPKGGGAEWVYKALILKPESMSRAGIEVDLYHQIFVATGGSGMLSINPAGMVDGYLLADKFDKKTYTFIRHDFFGIPTERAAERYDKLFITDVKKLI